MQHTQSETRHPAILPTELVAHQPLDIRGWFTLRLFWRAAVVVVAAVLLVLAQSLVLSNQEPPVRLTPDDPAAAFLTEGLYQPEQDTRGTYRWTTGSSVLRLPAVGRAGPLIFHLHLGPTFPTHPISSFRVSLNDEPPLELTASDQPRQYALLVPDASRQSGELVARLQSSTVTVPPDTRAIGLRIEQAALTVPGAAMVWLTPAQVVAQTVLLALCAAILARLSVPLLPFSGLLLLAVGLLLLLTLLQPLLLYPYVLRFVVALAFLAVLTYLLLPQAERHLGWLAPPSLLRVLWGIVLLACLLRLGGSLYPLFAAFDLDLNVGRFIKTGSGNLVVISRSIEFRNGFTVYPPGAYITMLPGVLLGLTPPLLIQGSLAIIDGFGALTTAALALALGAGRRTAIFSALLYAAIPIHLTALWFGLTAQIFGQALMAPLAIAVLVALGSEGVRQRRAWIGAGLLLTMSLLTHIGVAVVAAVWLGMAWLLTAWKHTVTRVTWWRFFWVLVISGTISLVGIYSYVIWLKIEEMLYVTDKIQHSGYVPAYSLIWRAFEISFHELGFVLLLPGLLLLWLQRHRLPRGGGAVVLAWLGIVVLFVTVEMLTALQVRYLYFLTPLACMLIGLVLAGLSQRGRAGQTVAWAIVALLLVQGSIIWYRGAWHDVMMSMTPLLR